MMLYRIFSASHRAGVIKGPEWLTAGIIEAVEAEGVARATCPCCTKKIVVRWEDGVLSDRDAAFLDADQRSVLMPAGRNREGD